MKIFFDFSNREKKQINILLIILVFIVILSIIISSFEYKKEFDYSNFKNKINAFEKSIKYYEGSKNIDYDEVYSKIQLFAFNPNTATDEDFTKLGLNDKQIKTIRNFLNKGGKFYQKEYFAKIYGINPTQYLYLEPYIKLPSKFDEKDSEDNFIFNKKEEKQGKISKLFNFNPNLINREEWEMLGFTEKQINSINKYKEKGGKFYKKEQLQKIYGITDEHYKKLEPYIIFEEKQSNKIEKISVVVEINSADTLELVKIKGIGATFAKNIIKYREMLGGYVDKQQLKEVWGIDEKKFNEISNFINIDKTKIRKINLNKAEFKEINKHPYIDYEETKNIVNYRKIMGTIKDPKELLRNNLIKPESFEKVKEYLAI